MSQEPAMTTTSMVGVGGIRRGRTRREIGWVVGATDATMMSVTITGGSEVGMTVIAVVTSSAQDPKTTAAMDAATQRVAPDRAEPSTPITRAGRTSMRSPKGTQTGATTTVKATTATPQCRASARSLNRVRTAASVAVDVVVPAMAQVVARCHLILTEVSRTHTSWSGTPIRSRSPPTCTS